MPTRLPQRSTYDAVTFNALFKEKLMRKIIMMAIAGFVWKKVQAKLAQRGATGTAVRRV